MWHWIRCHLGWVSAAGIGVFLAVCGMLRGLVFRRVLRRLDEARMRLNIEAKKHFATPIGQPDHKVIAESGVWPWLAEAALNWERDKKRGRY
jgi:hypothetical protein